MHPWRSRGRQWVEGKSSWVDLKCCCCCQVDLKCCCCCQVDLKCCCCCCCCWIWPWVYEDNLYVIFFFSHESYVATVQTEIIPQHWKQFFYVKNFLFDICFKSTICSILIGNLRQFTMVGWGGWMCIHAAWGHDCKKA